ncbi:MAG TPA: EAL domain-containing protein [Dyella sp.]|nr:EAL domain-containing protein [Dyella sp.]
MNADAHVLVVDDNENNRFMLMRYLHKLGFRRITEADDGTTALERIRESRPDLVLLDVIMPDMDGVQMLEVLRREGHMGDMPVIMVSAHDTMEIVVRCIELGAEDYLTKPIQTTMLRARMMAILEKRRLREIELEFVTHFDPDTHLPNRHALLERIERLLAGGRRFALVAISCRNHGSIALSSGEDDASARLRALNDRVQSSGLPTDIVARVGDGTVAWLLPDVSPDHVLLRAVEDVLAGDRRGGADIASDCTAAIAVGPPADPAEGASDLLRLAMSEAMRISPESSERVLIADPALRTEAREALVVLREVERALGNEELLLYFQPIFDRDGRRLVGAEALLRWMHPERGLLAPGAFLGAVEASPLMETIDLWAVATASQALASWVEHLPDDFRLHVNLTAHSIMSGRLPAHVEQVVPPGLRRYLTLELTERVHVVDMPACVGALQQVRALGLQVALDDFGTGFSSLSHINLLPCDLLKIDRSFVTGVDGDPKRRRLLSSLVGMAQALELGVVAEGIEREEDLRVLQEFGPLQLQGYLLGRPMPGAELLGRMRA